MDSTWADASHFSVFLFCLHSVGAGKEGGGGERGRNLSQRRVRSGHIGEGRLTLLFIRSAVPVSFFGSSVSWGMKQGCTRRFRTRSDIGGCGFGIFDWRDGGKFLFYPSVSDFYLYGNLLGL